MIRYRGLLFLMTLAWSLCCQAEREPVAYAVESFEETSLPVWCGRSDAGGRCEPVSEPCRDGVRALRLHWDFSRCADADMRFVNFFMHRPVCGQIEAVRLWVYSEPVVAGTFLKLWLEDAKDEVYIDAVTVDWEGWKQVTFTFRGRGPAWRSGDGNGVADLPMRIFGLSVDGGGPDTGSIVVDELSVEALAEPVEALDVTLAVPAIAWGGSPLAAGITVRNRARNPARDVVFDVEITDVYHQRAAWSDTWDVPVIPGDGAMTRDVAAALPFGTYDVRLRISSAAGLHHQRLARVQCLPGECASNVTAAVADYDRQWSLAGGVFGFIDPPLARASGAAWIRFEGISWETLEPAPDTWDMTPLRPALRAFTDAGIEPIFLQTLYNKPAFRSSADLADFAAGYGEAMGRIATESEGLCCAFELGNEDNGPSKFIYTEIARNGAAAVRRAQPLATVANSGTAMVDLNWLRMHAERGLFSRLDALCVHPYTNNSTASEVASPERFGMDRLLTELQDVIDELGGMKQAWSTEYGWPNGDAEAETVRARLYARHLIVGAACGLDRHGLYTWRRDYGVVGQPAGASVLALTYLTQGHRFAGVLAADPDVWIAVWERSGLALAALWSPSGKGRARLPVSAQSRVLDMFGNTLQPPRELDVEIPLGYEPIYVTEADGEALRRAVLSSCRREAARASSLVKGLPVPTRDFWARCTGIDPGAASELKDALLAWPDEGDTMSLREQAALSRVLRWYLHAARLADSSADTDNPGAPATTPDACRSELVAMVRQGIDIPALRWMLNEWDRVTAERRMAEDDDRAQYAAQLRAMDLVLAHVAHGVAQRSPRYTVAVWPYLHPGTGGADETLVFVPGRQTTVHARLVSYLERDVSGELELTVPEGWTCTPPVLSVAIAPGRTDDQVFRVECPPGATQKPAIMARLRIPGRPEVTVPFLDIRVEPAVTVTLPPLQGPLPLVTPHVRIHNRELTPLAGMVRLAANDGDGRSIARADFPVTASGDTRDVPLPVVNAAACGPFAGPLICEVQTVDGRTFRDVLPIEYLAAPRLTVAPTVDGDPSDWPVRLPLRLNREEYTRGSYGLAWTEDDCSADVSTAWDDTFLYVQATVRDQTFNQQLMGEAVWNQDSIQILAAAGVDTPWTEFCLALTPAGPQVWRTGDSEPLAGARLAVVLQPGVALYEMALPWRAFKAMGAPHEAMSLRYAVAINDHDAVGARHYLERFTGSIVHGKSAAACGELVLLGPLSPGPLAGLRTVTFREDFEEYAAPGELDLWRRITRGLPPDDVAACRVETGIGRDGSKGLRLRNSVGTKPDHYLLFVRSLPVLEPGTRYRLSAWMRGEGVAEGGQFLGTCSDLWGNESFRYIQGQIGTTWQQFEVVATALEGNVCNVIIRNHSGVEALVLDDIVVEPLP